MPERTRACGHAERRPAEPERGISVRTRRVVGPRRQWEKTWLSSTERERHREHRSGAGLAIDRDGAAVRLDDGLDQAQAQTEAAFGPARVAAEQTGPDPRQFVGWDARTGVVD